jgi:YjbE family integral membrane protein
LSPDLSSADLLTAIVGLIVINVVLSGDNAVVIGLAAHRLPPAVRRRAIVWGSVGAIGLRVVFTALAAYLLRLALLQLVGGVVLIWIAYRLLKPEDEAVVEALAEHASEWEAVQTIVLADVVMSLDNVLAIGGAARGDFPLMLVGLAISMPLIAVGGGLVAWLMNTLPWLVYVGSGILAWTAGSMIVEDSFVADYAAGSQLVELGVPALVTAVVLVAGFLTRRRGRAIAARPASRRPSDAPAKAGPAR